MNFEPDRSLYLNGDINTQTVMEVMIGITRLYSANPASVINLFMGSTGGGVSDGFGLYDYVMGMLKPKLNTAAIGEISSMAVPLYLMGELRIIGGLAVVRLHRFSTSPSSSLSSVNSAKISEELARAEEKYINILVRRTGNKISEEKANELMDKNITLTAVEAVQLGIAHKVSWSP